MDKAHIEGKNLQFDRKVCMNNIILRAILFGILVYFSSMHLMDGKFTFSDVAVGILLLALIFNEINLRKKK